MINSISNATSTLFSFAKNTPLDLANKLVTKYEDKIFTILNYNKGSNAAISVTVYDCSHSIEMLALGLIANPKGTIIGILFSTTRALCLFKYTRSLIFNSNFLEILNLATPLVQPKNARTPDEYMKACFETKAMSIDDYKKALFEEMWRVRDVTRITPIMEEFTYRIVIQKSTEWTARKICERLLPKNKTEKFGFTFASEGIKFKTYNINIPKIIAILTSSVLFAFEHSHYSLEGRIKLIPTAVVLGILADRYGITSSVSAHMMINLLAKLSILHDESKRIFIKRNP